MKYSQMSAEQRRRLLDDPANYPWRVAFLGKVGLLSFGEVAFLRRHEVDFDLDERQVEELLQEQGRGSGGAPARNGVDPVA